MEDTALYENTLFTDITGPSIRPGGANITKEAIDACCFDGKARILDIGCGLGASVEFIEREYGFECAGIDISEAMISEGLKRNKELSLACGDAHELRFAENSMDCVLAECSFSLMANKREALSEIKRVLKNGGYLALSDIYIKQGSPETQDDAQGKACFLHALRLDAFNTLLKEYGFDTVLFEDHTRELKELLADIILKYGSMRRFWEQIWNGEGCDIFCNGTRNIKLGYFLTVARLTKR